MAVDVVCPHCETQFHLQPDMLGKSMRCPECKDVFTVSDAKAPKEVPYERIEAAPPLVLEAEAVSAPKPAAVLAPLPLAIPLPAKPMSAAMPAVREVDWSQAAPPPSRAAAATTPVPTLPLNLDLPKPRRNIWPLVLTGLIVVIALLTVGTVAKVLYDNSRRETIMADQAEASFKDLNFPEAAKQFDDLLTQYPESPKADRYKFFAVLSALKAAVGSVGLRDDPASVRAKWEAFLKEFAGSPLAKTDDAGYGVSIFEAGNTLADGHANHAEDRLKKYRGDRSKLDNLSAAEMAVVDGRKLIPVVERYRPPEVEPLDKLRARFDGLGNEFTRERRRLEVLAPYRNLADDPVEDRIAEFTATLARTGFSDDAEARSLIDTATAKLRKLLIPIYDPGLPVDLKAADERPLISVDRPGGDIDPSPPPPDLLPDTFFARARGWLYALDADGGAMLWTTRVGFTAAPMRVTLPDGGSEIVLVPSLIGGQAGLTCRDARTGKARWHQPLEAPIAGAAAVVGTRVYVPLADAAGTFIEYDITNGQRISRFRLRQRIGAGIVRIPESSLILVAAEARRLFVIDVAPQDAHGERMPMRLRQVILSDHPELSLRLPPVFCGAGKPTMILVQNEGANFTRVRALQLPEMPPLAADAVVPESPAADAAASILLPGQVSFTPPGDGERVAIVTDVGAFGLYRTNGPGNLDNGLFATPAVPLAIDYRDPLPALAALAGEESTWVFARGTRTLLQQSFNPSAGFKLVPRGTPLPAGLPSQPLAHFPQRGTAGLVERNAESDSWRAVCFDLESGRVRWTRTLGHVAAAAPIIVDGGAMLVDEDGGVQKLTPSPNEAMNAERIAPPLVPTAGTAQVASSASATWILIPTAKGRVKVREIRGGKRTLDLDAALPAALAGRPVVLGDSLVVPLADSFLYRFDPATKVFTAGPMWRGASAVSESAFLTTIGNDEVLASDGGRRIGRWRWPGGGEWSVSGPAIELRDAVAMAPILLPAAERKLLLAAEANGSVVAFDLDRVSEPLRRWRPSDEGKLPAGRPSLGFHVLPRASGLPLIVYAVDRRHLVALDFNEAAPVWVISRPANEYDILDMAIHDGRLIVTDLAGIVSAYDAKGELLGRQQSRHRDLLPRTAAVPLGDKLLLSLTDGTLITLPGFRKANP